MFYYSIRTFLPERTVYEARLTKTAAPYAAPQHLYNRSVMDYLAVRHNKGFRIKNFVKVFDNTLSHGKRRIWIIGNHVLDSTVIIIVNVVKGRHIDTLDSGSRLKELFFGTAALLHFGIKIHKLKVDFLALAYYKQVYKVRQRLWIAHTGSSGNNYRHIICTFFSLYRQSRKVEHIQNICITQLVLNCKAYKVKLLYRVETFQSVQRNIVFPHKLLKIHPRRKYAFAPEVLPLIFQRI